MEFTYIKIDMTYNGYPAYYKQPKPLSKMKAVKFNEKYIYYIVTEKETICLGKFKKITTHNSNCRWDDYDYNVYEFTERDVFPDDINNIYCSFISEDSSGTMIEIKNTKYKSYPVYYKI